MTSLTSKLGISITLLILIVVFLVFLQSGVFGAAVQSVTIETNSDLENGLVGYWSFDGTDIQTQVTDQSSNNNPGYFNTNGEATSSKIVPGNIGQAVLFDGVDDFVNMGDPAGGELDFGTSQDFALSAWIKVNDGSNYNRIISKGFLSGTVGYETQLFSASSTVLVGIGGGTLGTSFQFYGDTTVADGKWHHVISIFDQSSKLGWQYVDGVLQNLAKNNVIYCGSVAGSGTEYDYSACGSVTASSAEDLNIGRQQNGAGSEFFDGIIDDVRIYNRTLSADEVKRLYELGATTHVAKTLTVNPDLENGLVGHWTFDGSDIQTQVTDRSSNNNSGYFYTNGDATSTKIVPGNIGQGVLFDGTDDYINIGDPAGGELDFGTTQDFAVAAWIKVNDGTSDNRILSKGLSSGAVGWEMQIFSGSSTVIGGEGGGSAATSFQFRGDTTVTDGKWHHVVNIFDQSAKLAWQYVDGVLQNLTKSQPTQCGVVAVSGTEYDYSACGSATASSASDLNIGRNNIDLGEHFDGIIDDVRIYNRTLSADEAKRLYELGATTHIANTVTTNSDLDLGLVTHWTFDGKDMLDGVTDTSGSGNTGSLRNFSATTTAPGRMGQGMLFTSANSEYIESPNFDEGAIDTITFSAWVKNVNPSPGVNQGILYKQTADFELALTSSNVLVVWIANPTWHNALTTSAYSDWNEWHHVAAVYDGANVRIYRDGSQVAVSGSETGNIGNNNASLLVGLDSAGSGYWNGVIDDVRMYTRALSAEEIQRLYELGQ